MRRTLVLLPTLALVIAACRTVQTSGPAVLDNTVEGLREQDGGMVDLVWADGGSVTIPQDRFAPPYCDARLNPRVPFPPELRDAGVYGEAQVKCIVLPNGSVERCGVLQSVGEAMDTVLLTAVQGWRCRPAFVGNVPVAAAHVAFFNFGPRPAAPDAGAP
jgi:TonB family protein